MRREILIHLTFFLVFFVLISILKGWLKLNFWPLWLGGIFGSLLPDFDHFIYIFFLGPQELTSQRVIFFLRGGHFIGAARLLIDTRMERTKLIFHTAIFEAVSLILAIWLITSSGNILAKGMVFAIVLHLLIDQLVDVTSGHDISRWFGDIGISFDRKQSTVVVAGGFLILIVLAILA